jgi:hypothetical protein
LLWLLLLLLLLLLFLHQHKKLILSMMFTIHTEYTCT